MSRKGAAFTLIELLVVLVIIGVIIAIVLPALGIVRNTTRKSTTDGMLRQITNAVGAFQNDHKRLPGYFSARDMADVENETAGFDAMKNLMLELAGVQPIQNGGVLIGPRATAQIRVEPNSIGVGGENFKAYWVPDGRHFKAQTEAGQQVGTTDNVAWPSVVDEWQNPVIAWVKDETMIGQAKTVQQFAKRNLTGPADPPAHFYWAPNAAFLQATAFGKRSVDQSTGSAIGSAGIGSNLENSLAGMLGNPNDPYKDPNLASASMPYNVPGTGRAPFMVHSAGADGVFVGKSDRGFKQFATGFIDYRNTFAPGVTTPIGPTNQWTDKNDKPTNRDVMTQFDDVLVGGGN